MFLELFIKPESSFTKTLLHHAIPQVEQEEEEPNDVF